MTACFYCNGKVEDAVIDQFLSPPGGYLLVKGLHVKRCTQCHEVFFEPEASQAIDDAIARSNVSEERISVTVVPAEVA